MNWLQFGVFFVGAMGLGLAGMVYLGRRLDRLEQHINEHFDRLDAHFDRLDERFDRIEETFDRIEAHFDLIDANFDRMDAYLNQMEGEINSLGEGLQHIEDRQPWMLGYGYPESPSRSLPLI